MIVWNIYRDLSFSWTSTTSCALSSFQCYEWALDAMKYMASHKMDDAASSHDLALMLTSLNDYLAQNPPITPRAFASMEELSEKLDNRKLTEQCKVARARCAETEELLRKRQETLRRTLTESDVSCDVSKLDSCQEQPGRDDVSERTVQLQHSSMSSHIFGPVKYRNRAQPPLERPGSSSSPHPPSPPMHHSRPQLSSPVGPSLDFVNRRRSYAGRPSAPVYSPSAEAFKNHLQGATCAQDCDEQLFYEGLITEDMSHRVVANLPKSLSDYSNLAPARNSRENLLTSTSDVTSHINHDSKQPQSGASAAKDSSANSTPTSKQKQTSQMPSFLAHNPAVMAFTNMLHRHQERKSMRRASSFTSAPIAASSDVTRTSSGGVARRSNASDLKEKREVRSLSLKTSSDSLPR